MTNFRATYFFFNFLLLPFYPLLAAYLLWRRFVQKKSAASFRAQRGIVPREVTAALGAPVWSTPDAPIIWIHAVSVGEQMAARPIARALKAQMPNCKIALSCTTDTGFQTAQTCVASGDADAAFYFPLDLPFAVSRALNAIRPDVFLAVETELWPNFLHQAKARGVLCFLINGRVSDNLQKRAGKTKWLWRWMIFNLDGLLMRSEFDAARMREIAESVGARESEKIVVMGDVKLDGSNQLEKSAALRKKWRDELKLSDCDLLFIFGSTHAGEEEIALRAFEKLKQEFPNLKLLIAPRHIERAPEVIAIIALQKLSFWRRSETDSQNNFENAEVLLLDSVGELSEIYAAADLAFVGGSLIPRGGHNVLEPILRGVPVVFGPHMANFRGHAELVSNSLLGNCCENEEQLLEASAMWLRDAVRRKKLPALAEKILAPHQGAPARIAVRIAEELKSKF